MDDILKQLNRVRGVGGCLLCSSDGLPVASLLREGTDENALSANIAEIISRSHKMATSVGIGKPHLVHAGASGGGMLVMASGKCFLVVITNPSANLALLHLEVRPFADAIAKRLSI